MASASLVRAFVYILEPPLDFVQDTTLKTYINFICSLGCEQVILI